MIKFWLSKMVADFVGGVIILLILGIIWVVILFFDEWRDRH